MADEAKQNKYGAQRKYDAKNTVMFSFSVNRKTEPDLLEHLQKTKSRASYIKRLIREDMEKNS